MPPIPTPAPLEPGIINQRPGAVGAARFPRPVQKRNRTTSFACPETAALSTVEGLRPHEFAVHGLLVHPRILPGFSYRVRPLSTTKYLFGGKALQLASVGCGYGKRITFKPEAGSSDSKVNENNNYFWSDSRPEGFGFELEVISPGDQFTIYDSAHNSVGMCQVIRNKEPQVEQSHLMWPDGTIEKWVLVHLTCKLQTHDGSLSTICITGMAIASKPNSASSAKLLRVMNCHVQQQFKGTPIRKYTFTSQGARPGQGGPDKVFSLEPGIVGAGRGDLRRVTVDGVSIADVPTSYTITGLAKHELAVIGTFVDSRVLPGFHYVVRPMLAKRPLFDGASLQLLSVGRGYGKRFTFESKTKNVNEHYFWSDSYNEGFGFAPHEVMSGQKFKLITVDNGQELGTAVVRKDDLPQTEVEMVLLPNGGVLKRLRVELVCHLVIDTNVTRACRVYGTAVVVRDGLSGAARVERIENPGLDALTTLHHIGEELVLVAVH